MCSLFFFLFPTRMLCIKKIASILETDIFTSIHKCSSYNIINSFPHMILSHPHSIQRKSKALHPKSTVMQIYGSWFQPMRKNVVWSKEKGHRTKGCIHWEVRQTDTRISFCKAGIFPARMGHFTTNPHCSVVHTWGPALPNRTPGKVSPLWSAETSPIEQRYETTKQHTPAATMIPIQWGSQNPILLWTTATLAHPWIKQALINTPDRAGIKCEHKSQITQVSPQPSPPASVLNWLILRTLTLQAAGLWCILSVASFNTAVGLVNLASRDEKFISNTGQLLGRTGQLKPERSLCVRTHCLGGDMNKQLAKVPEIPRTTA